MKFKRIVVLASLALLSMPICATSTYQSGTSVETNQLYNPNSTPNDNDNLSTQGNVTPSNVNRSSVNPSSVNPSVVNSAVVHPTVVTPSTGK